MCFYVQCRQTHNDALIRTRDEKREARLLNIKTHDGNYIDIFILKNINCCVCFFKLLFIFVCVCVCVCVLRRDILTTL
jgi:hypothetical protein